MSSRATRSGGLSNLIQSATAGRRRRKILSASLIVGESPEMAAVLEQVEQAAETDTAVLIEGEPGTGRELVARTIHYAGPRRGADFVAVKATTIPRELLEGELFGPRAVTLRRANGGTLLLKDLDALPRGPQRGLAQVLRRRRPNGGTLLLKDPVAPPGGPQRGLARVLRRRDREESGELFDVRIIGASDGDLGEAVASSGFDRELYARLVTRIRIPPLRKRL